MGYATVSDGHPVLPSGVKPGAIDGGSNSVCQCILSAYQAGTLRSLCCDNITLCRVHSTALHHGRVIMAVVLLQLHNFVHGL